MAIMVNNFQVDERYSSLLLPNLFFGDWMVPGVTYNDEYERDATGAGGIWVRKLKITPGDPTLPGGDYTNTVRVEGGKIAIVQSTCPGSDCVHSGWMDTAGQAIVCLPNKVIVRIEGGASQVDTATQ